VTEHTKLERTPIAQAKSRLADFRATSLSLFPLDVLSVTSDGRDGHHNWSLYGNSGSQPIQSAGAFALRSTDFYGMEATPTGPGHVGTSRYEFSEQVQHFTATGTITFTNGTVQKVTGQVPVMLSAMQIWSGRVHEQDTPASAQYYINQTIRRQRVQNIKFHLVILPVQRAFDGHDVGYQKLRIFNDSTNALLQEQDLVLAADPHAALQGFFEVSDMVGVNDFLRAEIIAQIALSNPNSPQNPIVGGSIVGAGFLDNAT
jgi:hypothetical protein